MNDFQQHQLNSNFTQRCACLSVMHMQIIYLDIAIVSI